MSVCEFAEAPADRRRSIFYDPGHGSDDTMDNSCRASGMTDLMTLEPALSLLLKKRQGTVPCLLNFLKKETENRPLSPFTM